MPRSTAQLRSDAQRIWQAGLSAVRSDKLVLENVRVDGRWLSVGDEALDLDMISRIVVVGAGKAGAGMASGLETAFGPTLSAEKRLSGWVNVPANCLRPLEHIHLHPARPAHLNEPTTAGVAGAEKILQLLAGLGPDDLCLALISGGGSALLPAPAAGISLEEKLAFTRFLSDAGADITELNTVRKQLSRIKGGGLARACRAGRLISLIISDVLGDPLEIIASGPTVPDASNRQQAWEILNRYGAREARVAPAVLAFLERTTEALTPSPTCKVSNLVIGNLAVAVDAAGLEAERLGYSHAMVMSKSSEGFAEDVGRHLARLATRMQAERGPDCLISGGEPVVKLIDAGSRGLGGRNQQLVLAAAQELERIGGSGICLLSAGTDGEDGPTDAAGAILDPETMFAARQKQLDPADFLGRNDAYHFFEPLRGLFKTGPTDTNVCDVRVVLVDRVEQAGR